MTSAAVRFTFRSHRFARVATLVTGVSLLVLSQAKAGTISAASASVSDITKAIASAVDGDTVVVPAGSASWTSTLTITKGITLQGATVVAGDHATGLTTTDQTIILDNVSRASTTGGALIKVTLSPTQSFRLTGFTFKYGTITAANSTASLIFAGTCPSLRMDHCHLDQLYGRNIRISGWLYGVIDHCVFDIRQGVGFLALVEHPTWNNSTNGWGSWADGPHFGSEKFIFFEDNVSNNLGGAYHGGIDAVVGGRYVARYNTFNNSGIVYHGTDSGGAYSRGTRAVEIYDNKFTNNLLAIEAGQDRSGPLLWYNNTYTGKFGSGMVLKVYRLFMGGPINNLMGKNSKSGWGAGNGTNSWDYNATEADGTHVDGHAPYTYATGTHVGVNNSTTVTVSGTPWKSNQWAGYSVTNTNSNSSYFNGCSYIVSNTGNTLTTAGGGGFRPEPKFNTGDTFAIHKVLIVLDQPGRGKGDLLRGPNPSPTWPHQALEPCYSWNNKLNGSNLNFGNIPGNNNLKENVDYHNNTPMPGYTPYTYPHPLTMETGR